MLAFSFLIIISVQIILLISILGTNIFLKFQDLKPIGLSKKKISVPEFWLSKFTAKEIIATALNQANNSTQISEAFNSSSNLDFTILQLSSEKEHPVSPIIKDINKILIKSNNTISLEQVNKICTQHSYINQSRQRLFAISPMVVGLFISLFSIIIYNNDMTVKEEDYALINLTISISLGLFAYFGILSRANAHQRKMENYIYQIEMFCQTELKSNDSSDLGTVLLVVQNSLQTFNEEFSKNMLEFKEAAVAIKENSGLQKDFVEKINQLSINDVANFNLQIIERFETALGQFDQFNKWFDQLNENTQNAQQLANKIDALSKSSDKIGTDIGTVAQRIDRRLNESHLLLQFLKQHFSEIEDRKHLISNSIINFDDFLQKALRELEIHTEERVNAIKEVTLREEDMMIKVFEKNRDALSHLSQLELLQTIYEQLTSLLERYGNESTYLNQGMRSILTKLDATNQNLELIRIEEQKKK